MCPIYMVSGCKGGVGKSIVSMALLDYMIKLGRKCLLIEADTANDDVFKAYGDSVVTAHINLDAEEGWVELVNLLDANQDSIAVINFGARSNSGVTQYGETLMGLLEDLKRKLVTFWVINTDRDGLELLKDYLPVVEGSLVHVVKNTYFGNDDRFDLYNSSKLRQQVEAGGGKSLVFPKLLPMVSRELYNNRLTIKAAIADTSVPLGNRGVLKAWQRKCEEVFTEAISE
jgi:hypothetical protein